MLIGLTGGIGAGKSTVSDYLTRKGYPVLDADKVAREIVEPGAETLLILSSAFGKEIINPDGSLNRGLLAEIAFSHPERKALLDRIMHGKVIEILLRQAEALGPEPLIFVDVPLLFESGMDRYMDRIWLVDAEDEVRILRVVERDGSSREEVLRRIGYQMDRAEKARRSDLVLDNSADRVKLYKQIDEGLNYLKEKKVHANK
ncbi:dephospho-CoA kinase [Bacillota bacterium]